MDAKLKSQIKKLDIAWSLLVKLKSGNKCAVCSKQTCLESHHIFNRSNMSVRWATDNGVCLCQDHHTKNTDFSAHQTPEKFKDWLFENYGTEFIEKLMFRAAGIGKFTYYEKDLILSQLQREIKSYE